MLPYICKVGGDLASTGFVMRKLRAEGPQVLDNPLGNVQLPTRTTRWLPKG